MKSSESVTAAPRITMDKVLDTFRAMSHSTREQGLYYEKFCRLVLLKAKMFQEVAEAWLWKNFPYGQSKQDTGIDVVARTHTGEFWAIQCKFWENPVTKEDIDSFFSFSGGMFKGPNGIPCKYARKILFTTTELNKNAQQLVDSYSDTQLIVTRDIESLGLDLNRFWPDFNSKIIEQDGDDIRGKYWFEKRQLRDYQEEALRAVVKGFKTHDKGKLIMACGTGKTLTALRIAEKQAGAGGVVLYLVPSLSLVAQTLKEWTADAEIPIRPIIVCSDSEIHEQTTLAKEDIFTESPSQLPQPATTKPQKLVDRYEELHSATNAEEQLIVVFSTYQSSRVVSEAQTKVRKNKFPPFDLAICDEAHRTTGAKFGDDSDKDVSNFMLIHDEAAIRSDKRLFMTATPRVYTPGAKETAKKKAAEHNKEIILADMGDEKIYGPEFYRLNFGDAVSKEILCDYKVVILTLRRGTTLADYNTVKSVRIIDPDTKEHVNDQGYSMPVTTAKRDEDDDSPEIDIDDFTKIIGCWSAICKKTDYADPHGDKVTQFTDTVPMKRLVSYINSIKNSKRITEVIPAVVGEQIQNSPNPVSSLQIEVEHIDGSFRANARKEKLDWLKADPGPDKCRILSNVRCLSEGVDVPALDGIIFFAPRKSQIEVVQSVGRVMRNAPGKKYGYVILPVVFPDNEDAAEALDRNKNYRVVWQVLQALRSHDSRLDIFINKLKFKDNSDDPGKSPVLIGGESGGEDDGTVKVDGTPAPKTGFLFDAASIGAKIVKRCGDRDYLQDWAEEVSSIAANQITEISEKLKTPTPEQKQAYGKFLARLREELNPSITGTQAVEMLAQHIVAQPIFDALFTDYSFSKENVVSKALQEVVDVIQPVQTEREKELAKEITTNIRHKIEGIKKPSSRQEIIRTIYEQFFRHAFKTTTEKLGIVYTPVEVVDFVIHSVEYVLKKHFNRRLSNQSVHILDPFTGTGTFLTRLLQSGLIDRKDLERKYREELHANEIVLLAYYIASINIEQIMHDLRTENAKTAQEKQAVKYTPFPGIVLTDTFQLNEKEAKEHLNDTFVDNNERITRQKKTAIEVIIGNPPYSAKQGSANDNSQNEKYPKLDKRIEETYVVGTDASNKNSLYDSYIRAFRWASDRLGDKGVIAFVTNGGWLDGNATNGIRECFADEFSDIYVFNLRGDARSSGIQRQKEKGNVFGEGSRTSVTITILVKAKKEAGTPANISYHDIGDYLSRNEKLDIIQNFKSVENIPWETITPNNLGDWINQRGDVFPSFIALGGKKQTEDVTFFKEYYSRGLATSRDYWAYNYSKRELEKNISNSIVYYNQQVDEYQKTLAKNKKLKVDDFLTFDSTKFSWCREQKKTLASGKKYQFSKKSVRPCLYRPYTNQYAYFDKDLKDQNYKLPSLFPTVNTPNLLICLPGIGSKQGFTCIITDQVPDVQIVTNSQCFPLYYYKEARTSKAANTQAQLDFDDRVIVDGYERQYAITDAILAKAQGQYKTKAITKEDIFYYVYGILHSQEYRNKYFVDLRKSLARIPLVTTLDDFNAFRDAGWRLSRLHLTYSDPAALSAALAEISGPTKSETHKSVPSFASVPVDVVYVKNAENLSDSELYHVQKLRYAKKGKTEDRSILVYNSHVTVRNIPITAQEYVVNGRSALDWLIDRYQIKTDTASQITNDPNLYDPANPKYILDLIQSVVTVSVNTMKIVSALPKLRF